MSRGPVFSEFKVAHPFGEQGQFRHHRPPVRRTAADRHPHADAQQRDSSSATGCCSPRRSSDGQSVHEIPFGAIERPAGIEFPAQNWVDYGNGQQGVALLNRGLPGNNVADGTMMLSLLRSTRIVAYGFGGGYEPGMSSDSAWNWARS